MCVVCSVAVLQRVLLSVLGGVQLRDVRAQVRPAELHLPDPAAGHPRVHDCARGGQTLPRLRRQSPRTGRRL